MALYEFRCKKCGKLTEKMFPMTKNVKHIKCECGYISNRVMSSGIFKIEGYSEKNGYSKENK